MMVSLCKFEVCERLCHFGSSPTLILSVISTELALRYRALIDFSLEVTREQFNTQYIVWPLSERMDPQHSRLLKKWMYKSVANATLDELSYNYFEVKLCPLGLSGPNCDQYCNPKHGLSDRDGKCICSSTKWTGADCSVEVKEDRNTYPPWEVAMCYSFFGINTLAVLVCASWIYWQRNTHQVKVWQPFFLYLVLLGCLVSSSSIIPAVQQSSQGNGNVPACMVFPWLFSVGFSITFGSLFAKIRRVYILFKAAATMNRVTVTVKETFLIVCAITSVDVLICMIWTIVDPLSWQRTVTRTDLFGEPLESVGYCTSNYWKVWVSIIAIWHLVLMIFASVLCYKTRNIDTRFSESKYVAVGESSNARKLYGISF